VQFGSAVSERDTSEKELQKANERVSANMLKENSNIGMINNDVIIKQSKSNNTTTEQMSCLPYLPLSYFHKAQSKKENINVSTKSNDEACKILVKKIMITRSKKLMTNIPIQNCE